MGGAEIGGIFEASRLTAEQVQDLKTIRDMHPEKFGHIVMPDEVPSTPAQTAEENTNA